MSRRKKTSNRDGRWISMKMVQSQAWLTLKGACHMVYLLILCKAIPHYFKPSGKPGKEDGGWGYSNNGKIVFTYDKDAKQQYGIIPSRLTRALDGLISHGFLDVITSGMGVRQLPTFYAISDRWKKFGTPDFVEARRPEPSIANPGFRPGNDLWKKAKCHKRAWPVRITAHGDDSDAILVMRTNAHGKKVKTLFKVRSDKWLASNIA